MLAAASCGETRQMLYLLTYAGSVKEVSVSENWLEGVKIYLRK